MRISNVHERIVDGTPEQIAPLLASLGQPEDQLYPPLWDPMTLDGPVAVGARGSHGTISAYQPGRLLRWTFPSGMGITGTHAFTITDRSDQRSLVRHEVVAEATIVAWIAWKALIQPAHDAVLEQVLDRCQTALGSPPARPTRLSAYARLLRWWERPRATDSDEPHRGLIVAALPRADHTDTFVIERRRETSSDAEAWSAAVFDEPPRWVAALFAIRERLIGVVGIEEAPEDFTTCARSEQEVLLGADADHLSFRVALRCEPTRVVASSAVQVHNTRGRLYHGLIRHIHPVVMRGMLNRAASRLARRQPAASGQHTKL